MQTRGKKAKPGGGKKKVIRCAIDFGTTFTSVAYERDVYSQPRNSKPLSGMHRLDPFIVMEDAWGAGNGPQVPTELLYAKLSNRNDKPRWKGNEVLDAYERQEVPLSAVRVRLSKVLLHDAQETREGRERLNGLAAGAGKDPFEFIREFLMYVQKSIQKYFRSHHIPLRQNTEFEYVFGFPPAWSIQEQHKLVEIAENSGLPCKFIGSEAEAMLAVYLAEDNHGLKKGDAVIIVDAGGATVDLITVQILSLDPLEVRQTCLSEGVTCGGEYVDERFLEFVKRRLGPENLDQPEQKYDDILRKFQAFHKLRFRGQEKEAIKFWVNGLRESETHGLLRNGQFSMSSAEMERIFKPSADQLIERTRSQYFRSRKSDLSLKIKRVAIGGGFGSSPYLVQRLRTALQKLDKKITLDELPKRGGLNVPLGLLLLASNQTWLKQRRSRINYGLLTFQDYDARKHGDGAKPTHLATQFGEQVELVQWFLLKDQVIPDSEHPFIWKDRVIGIFDTTEMLEERLFVFEGDLAQADKERGWSLADNLPEGIDEYNLTCSIEGIDYDRHFKNVRRFASDQIFPNLAPVDESSMSRYDQERSPPPPQGGPHFEVVLDLRGCQEVGNGIESLSFSMHIKSKCGELVRVEKGKKILVRARKPAAYEQIILGSSMTRITTGEKIVLSDFCPPPMFPGSRKRARDEYEDEDEEEYEEGYIGGDEGEDKNDGDYEDEGEAASKQGQELKQRRLTSGTNLARLGGQKTRYVPGGAGGGGRYVYEDGMEDLGW